MPISPHISKLEKLTSNTPPDVVEEYEHFFITAVQRAQVDDIKVLLKLGVDPNCRVGEDQMTALHLLAGRGDMRIFDMLYATNKLNLNILSFHGTPAITLAVNANQEKFVEKMAVRGANVNLPNRFGLTPLHQSVYCHNTNIMRILLVHDCARDPLDLFFASPLSIAAVDVGSLPMVRMLVENGAQVNFNRGHDTLPLLLEVCLQCSSPKYMEIAIYLLDVGADPNATESKTGRNALHIVAISNNVEMANLLIERGTLSTIKDVYNLLPFELAMSHKNEEVAEVLEVDYVHRKASEQLQNVRNKSQLVLPTLLEFAQEQNK